MVSMGPLQMCGGAIGDCQQLGDAGLALMPLHLGKPLAQSLCHYAGHAVASRLSNGFNKPVRFGVFDIKPHRAPLQKIVPSFTTPHGGGVDAQSDLSSSAWTPMVLINLGSQFEAIASSIGIVPGDN